MNSTDIVNQRLHNQGLIKPLWKSPHDVVKAFGAVQAQDYPGAKWAIGQRLSNSLDADIEKAMTEGTIIRTHVLRPTWHFVTPEDIRWMLDLTAPRIKRIFASYYKTLNLDEQTLQKSNKIFEKVLKGKHLVRSELRAALEEAGIATKGMRFGFILAYAELEGLICSGARKDKRQTYALLNERAPLARSFTPKKPLVELVTRYFTTHGPATVHDFVWWAFVKVSDVKKALEESNLKSAEIEGKTYWFADDSPKTSSSSMHILPNYDEYISYKDRGHYFESVIPKSALMNHFIVQNGKMIGGWKSPAGKDIKINLFKSLSPSEKQALSFQLKRYSAFTGQTSKGWEKLVEKLS